MRLFISVDFVCEKVEVWASVDNCAIESLPAGFCDASSYMAVCDLLDDRPPGACNPRGARIDGLTAVDMAVHAAVARTLSAHLTVSRSVLEMLQHHVRSGVIPALLPGGPGRAWEVSPAMMILGLVPRIGVESTAPSGRGGAALLQGPEAEGVWLLLLCNVAHYLPETS